MDAPRVSHRPAIAASRPRGERSDIAREFYCLAIRDARDFPRTPRRQDGGSTRVEALVDGMPYEITEVTVAARPVAGVRARVARGQIAREFSKYLDLVYAAARDGKVSLDGQNIFIYRAADADYLTVEFCVGVTAPFASIGAVLPLLTPAGVAAMTTHRGDYRRLPEANAAIREWCHERGRRHAGPSWEVYGHWHEDPALLRTEVYYLLEPAGP